MDGSSATATATDSVSANNGLSGFAISNSAFFRAKRVTALYNRGNGILVDNAGLAFSEMLGGSNSGFDVECKNNAFAISFQDNTVESSHLVGCNFSTMAKF